MYVLFLGPEKWPHTYPEAAGSKQSPIDIKPVDLKTLNANRKLTWKYIPENTKEVSNPGYCWKVTVDGTGSGKRKNNFPMIVMVKLR